MTESLYERDRAVQPARVETHAGLRRRFKRGEEPSVHLGSVLDLEQR